jgi:hypothetical protein
MKSWQDEEGSSSSSSDDSVGVESNDRRVFEHDKQSQQHRQQLQQQVRSSRKSIPFGAAGATASPYRWIQDRVDGKVYTVDTGGSSSKSLPSLAPRPPCCLCWPPPLLKQCPVLLETNIFCTLLGRLGFCDGSAITANRHGDYYSGFGNRGRSAVMTYALVFNLCGLLLSIFATLALTDNNVSLLNKVSFSTTSLRPLVLDATVKEILQAQQQESVPTTILQLGLQALLIRDEMVVPFKDFCTTSGMNQFLPQQDCNACHETTVYITIGMVVTIVTYLPTMATDFLRIYKDYDVNCQKCVALLWSLVSLAGYGLTYYYYRYRCLDSFYHGPVLYDADGVVVGIGVDTTSGDVLINFDWTMGAGQICLVVGFVLKVVGFLCHCCVATPTITRLREEQWTYERISKEAELGTVEDADQGSNRKGEDDESSRPERFV